MQPNSVLTLHDPKANHELLKRSKGFKFFFSTDPILVQKIADATYFKILRSFYNSVFSLI